MLHVFLVDTGIMLKFDMELAVESVAYLMEAVHQRVFIPANKQVLLSANGEPLAPSNRVASYASCGTETQPIYLFSKSTIESPVPPSPSINLGSVESLKDEVEKSLKMKPKYETLVARAKLATEFQRLAVEIGDNCENLVNDQFLQKDGWRAVVLNLDHITSAFEQHVNVFEEYYRAFFVAKLQYNQMIQKYDHVLVLLKQLPLLSCLSGTDVSITLLQWISTHDKQSSIENLVRQCHEALQKCNEDALDAIVREGHKVLDSVNNEGMKEIKGLSERLVSLQQRLRIARQLIQDQTDMAQGFQQNQMRAEHVGDASVLPDLCASHQKQLIVLLKNHHQIREIRNLCARAKDELSTNLHARLRWVMYIEKSIFECDSRLLIYHESLKRIKKRLDIFEQVFEAPKMYILAVLEVLRRKSFSAQFLEWSKSVSESSIDARTEELNKREMFHKVFGNHFVKNLFPGLEKLPQPFAEEPSPPCDMELPDISVEDIKLLQKTAPDLMSELHIGDPLESSIVVRTCLSQSNLTKLVDPRQNKTLEETLTFREKALVDNKQLTMSVLKREMSCGDVVDEDFPFPGNVEFQLGSPDDLDATSAANTFEPASLQSLSREKILTTSSDSDALFHSAELDFSCPSPGVSSPLSPFLASPRSVKSSSGKSSSGKSSSSPIQIKSTTNHKRQWRHSQSLSPESIPANRGDIFSLPNIEQRSNASLSQRSNASLSIIDDVDGSQNSCRSLSEAIRTVEVNNRLVESSEVVMKTQKELKELKIQLVNSRHVAVEFKNTTYASFEEVKSTILTALRERDISLATLQEQYDEIVVEKDCLQNKCKADVEELKREYDALQQRCEKTVAERERILVSEKFESEEKTKTLLRERDGLLQTKKECACQIDELTSENTRLTGLVDEQQQRNSEYQQRMESLQEKCSSTNEEHVKLKKYKNNLSLELEQVKIQLGSLQNENTSLKIELEEFSETTQQSIDEHLSHVSSVTTQHKELKRKLAEKEHELSQALLMKDSLEAQKQTNFNTVFNKIKKEKDSQIRDRASQISGLEKELQSQKSRSDTLNIEINVHKEAYSTLESEFQKLKEVNKQLEEKVSKEKEFNSSQLNDNNALKKAIEELNQSVDDVRNEKLRVMQELKSQYDEELKKEKVALLLACEVEKVHALEEFGKSEHAIKMTMSTSIEEGIDMLEIDQLLEKVKSLEADNEQLKEAIASKDKKEDVKRSVSASPKAQKVVRTSDVKPVEKIAIRDLDIGSLILLCYDESTHHYVALTQTSEKYFLHPESLKQIQSGRASERKHWMFAYITEKELCVAKKPNNKFNLPVNTYFSRIHVKLYDAR